MMVEVKMWIIPVAALIPLILGFIWYNPKVLGTAWMQAAGLSEEDLQGANMGVMFFLSYVFANMVGFVLLGMAVHQLGFQSMVLGSDAETMSMAESILEVAGDNYRTFKHGALHGFMAGLFMILPVMGTNAMFERKSWKYIWLNVGYWIISLTIMGGIICEFA